VSVDAVSPIPWYVLVFALVYRNRVRLWLAFVAFVALGLYVFDVGVR
jgi:hypothetical protein